MKIWLDDLRDAPSGWVWIRYAEFLIPFLDRNWNKVECLSLDHDLTLPMTGYDVVKWIEEKVATEKRRLCFGIVIHSANPVGRQNMVRGILSAERISRREGGGWFESNTAA